MQANTGVIRNEAQALPDAWEEARCWATRLWSRERLASVGIAVASVAAFLALVGVVEYALYHAVQNWSISGVGPAVFGNF
jgi:hypothetical protein